jgi:hypothetical protein
VLVLLITTVAVMVYCLVVYNLELDLLLLNELNESRLCFEGEGN